MSTTDGGRANGMPRKWFVPLAVVPMNVPLSSVTIGPVEYFVAAAKTVAVAAQIETRNSRRKTMTAKEHNWRVARVCWAVSLKGK